MTPSGRMRRTALASGSPKYTLPSASTASPWPMTSEAAVAGPPSEDGPPTPVPAMVAMDPLGMAAPGGHVVGGSAGVGMGDGLATRFACPGPVVLGTTPTTM